MSLRDAYYAAKLGPAGTLAFTNGASTAAHRVLTEIAGPTLVMLMSTQDVHLEQGKSDMDAAATTSFLLLANTYWAMLIESESDNYLRAYGASADGSLVISNITNLRLTPRSA